MNSLFLALLLAVLQNSILFAQNDKGSFVVNFGYLHSLTKVTESPGNLVGIADHYGKPGLYAGIGYETIIVRSILSRSEIAYQNKGNRFDALQNGYFVKNTSDIHHLSLCQLIGLLRLKSFSFFAGPEINLLISSRKQNPFLENIEAGIAGCISYRLGRIALNLDYFRGFSRYARLGDNIQYFDLYNSNIRLGVGYSLSRTRHKQQVESFKTPSTESL